jgi:hypothetical protein
LRSDEFAQCTGKGGTNTLKSNVEAIATSAEVKLVALQP